ncbi:Hypothetical protein [Corynebacterium glutamicum ATCC 13032]|uniref:Uncharacterized protein n=1 Tax=Corynebacterium glutamicum (strain ATCC 13032 / DSM 20300 / JCM 1318 / BCRC 11384 / CCUG 27702 / LMG 3730 / NBRC 12168 / NCIMB 10025 / NRRL B-2784 / 534) TaxID=196627 RepID=Q8NQ00_CORGL|nr:Hypothetical protein [Corynebacterium glutamicum ATCC 13032]
MSSTSKGHLTLFCVQWIHIGSMKMPIPLELMRSRRGALKNNCGLKSHQFH